MMYRLEMKRGNRILLIGYFPTLYRAMQMPILLEWGSSWVAKITMVHIQEVPHDQTNQKGGDHNDIRAVDEDR